MADDVTETTDRNPFITDPPLSPSGASDGAPAPDDEGVSAGAPPGATEAPEGDVEVPADLTCPICGVVSASPRGWRTHRTRSHGSPSGVGDGAASVAPGASDGDTGETVPRVPPKTKRKLRDWLKSATSSKADPETKAKRERTRARRPRESLEEPAGWIYGGLGTMLTRSGGSDMVPVGKVMEMQRDIVGAMADEAIKGTLLDKVLQPIIASGRLYRELGETIGLPIMTAVIVKQPKLLGLKSVKMPNGEMGIMADGPFFQPYYSMWQTCAVQMAQGYERTEAKKRDIEEELRKIPSMREVMDRGMDPILFLIIETLGVPVDNGEVIDVDVASDGAIVSATAVS